MKGIGRKDSVIRESSRSWLGETKIPAHGLAVSVESRSAVGNDRVSHASHIKTPASRGAYPLIKSS